MLGRFHQTGSKTTTHLLKPLACRYITSTTTNKNKEKLFDKVLIANRGEIACRVIRSCKKLGIKTVAVYSEPDVNSVAVRMADEAVCVGPAQSKQSYLKVENIIKAVEQTGAQAVHPGYGFLSENQQFCAELEKRNVTFIGPGSNAIHVMGDKIESKLLAKNAKVNIIPGFLGTIKDEEEAVKIAREIGYPVMVKAAGGGGGKGMRVAYDDKEARIGYRLSKEEAMNSFNDDRIFVEKFIEDPRHIEMQVLADKHGNIVPFPERECSIQRRNQKVIEEAPSTLLDAKTRAAMGEQVKMLCKAVGYVSAGTVEFLCDKHKNFFFLEMNTRLQVEHPITEMITHVDLVEQMLRIAAGHPLPPELLKGPLPIYGWAMESRVYAEDPFRGFLPSIGRLIQYQEPIKKEVVNNGPGVRIDTGVVEGSDISMYYDPMICKLVTHGKDRDECLRVMQYALDTYVVRGPGHNIPFLQAVYRHPRYQSGKISTKFIPEEYPEGFKGVPLTQEDTDEMLATALYIHLKFLETSQAVVSSTPSSVFKTLKSKSKITDVGTIGGVHLKCARADTHSNSSALSSFIVGNDVSKKPQELALNILKELSPETIEDIFEFYMISPNGAFGEGTKTYTALLYLSDEDYEKKSNGYMIVANKNKEGQWNKPLVLSDIEWSFNGPLLKAKVNQSKNIAVQLLAQLPEGFRLSYHGAYQNVCVRSVLQDKLAKHMKPKPKVDTSKVLQCPMPGLLVSVSVKAGDIVEEGQEIVVIEAMKMQNILRSEKRAKIAKVNFKAGDSLKVDEVIVEFEKAE